MCSDATNAGRRLVRALFVVLTASLATRVSAASDPAKIAAEIDHVLAAEYPAGEPGAAVLVAKRDRVLLRKGYGLADVAGRVPVDPETVFRLASVTKVFTSTAVWLLAEQGRLSLDDRAGTFVPALPDTLGRVTVAQLLAHTAGLPEYLDRPDSVAWAGSDFTVAQLIDSFKDRSPGFSPGEKSVYSNSNYLLLGAILETVSGKSFGAVVRESIFDPLGMKSSSCDLSLHNIPRLALPYEPTRVKGEKEDWGRLVIARPYTMTALYAAGGCLSSVDDLWRFQQALAAGRLLKADALAASRQPVSLKDGNVGGTSNGGWQIDRVSGLPALMKGGALPGVCTWYLTMPDPEVTVLLLSNRSPGRPRCGALSVKVAGIAASL